MGNTCSYLVLKKKQKNSGISISFSKNSLKILYFSRNIRLNLYGYYCSQIIKFLSSLHHFPNQFFRGQSTFPYMSTKGGQILQLGGSCYFLSYLSSCFKLLKKLKISKPEIFKLKAIVESSIWKHWMKDLKIHEFLAPFMWIAIIHGFLSEAVDFRWASCQSTQA
jgi:hypothetical protein